MPLLLVLLVLELTLLLLFVVTLVLLLMLVLLDVTELELANTLQAKSSRTATIDIFMRTPPWKRKRGVSPLLMDGIMKTPVRLAARGLL